LPSRSGNREVGTEIEQIVLDLPQHRIELGRVGQMQPHDADRGQLVSSTVPSGADPQIVFRAALAAASAVVPSSPVAYRFD